MPSAPRRFLITGAAGFIGSRLTAYFRGRGDEVVASTVDVLDDEVVATAVRDAAPDCVIHLAAISHVPSCEEDPELATRTNVGGTAAVLAAMRSAAPKARLVFTSTAQVYQAPEDGSAVVIIDQARKVVPQNGYARTKWEAEQLIHVASQRDGLRATVLRLFNHTHKSQSARFFLPHLYTTIVDGLRAHPGRTIRIPVGNVELSRDMGSIQDLTAAFAAAIDRFEAAPHEVFNVCSGTAKRLSTLASVLADRLHATIELVTDPSRMRPGEPETILGSHEQLTAATGWTPRCLTESDLIDAFLAD